MLMMSVKPVEVLSVSACHWRAAERNVYLEINASPERLDIHAPLIRLAKSHGCKFVISTDAHHPKHLLNMHFGVSMARPGWLSPRGVLNTLPPQQFQKAIRPQ